MQSVTTATPRDETKTRYDRDGYLWVKNLIPRDDVLDMREQCVYHFIFRKLKAQAPD